MKLSNIRLIEFEDYNKKYLYLLKQLTLFNSKDNNINKNKWYFFFQKLKKNDNHFIFIIEDLENNIIVASITLFIELKVIRNFKYAAHIEDLIVHKDYRNLKLAHQLIEYCIDFSKKYTDQQCYKIILHCDEKLKPFYEKFKFTQKNIEMSLYF